MENYFNITNMIKHMLFGYRLFENQRYAIFVHSSVFNKFKESCGEEFNGVDYVLQIGNQNLDMKHIILDGHQSYVRHLILASMCTLPFEDQENLFTYSASFHILEKYINTHNLESSVIRIEEQTIPTCNERIKVVYFENHGIDIIGSYLNMINNENFDQPYSYQVTAAFQWLQPTNLNLLEYPRVGGLISKVFPQILLHLSTMDGLKALNIFDLVSLKISFCDPLDQSESNLLKFEIDYYINRKIKEMTADTAYATGDHFDLKKYVNDHSVVVKDKMIADYFLYKFYNYFTTINLDQTKLVTDKFNITLTPYNPINQGYENLNLLRIHLICNDNGELDLGSIHSETEAINDNVVLLNLTNGDEYWFCLTINCSNLNNLDFDECDCTVIIQELDIIYEFLTLLYRISTTRSYVTWSLENCSIEKGPEIWNLMNRSDFLEATIVEDEYIWQSIFDFVEQELFRVNVDKFRFRNRIGICCGSRIIDLRDIYFSVDETKSVLQLRTLDGKFIDLYHFKNGLVPDDRPDFE